MAWTGFTDEQLDALKRQTSDEDGKAAPSHRGRAQGQHSRGRGRPSGPNRGRGRTVPNQSGRPEPVSEDQMLSKPKHPRGKPVSREEHSVWSQLNEPTPPHQTRPPPGRRKAQPPSAPSGGETQHPSAPPRSGVRPPSAPADDQDGSGSPGTDGGGKEELIDDGKKEEEKVKILDESEGQVRELSKMEEFQKMQKQMEEDNAKKKSLLFRAIADRKKKTQAEAKRLAYIQKELAKIETLLTNDVSILRDRIETASRDFNEAQRRYSKAEAEFIAAKISLHKTSEMKEALTEHLCTIIHENELRKAKKLEELVDKLDVESLAEFENIPDDIVAAKPSSAPTSPIPAAPQQTVAPDNPPEKSGSVPDSSAGEGGVTVSKGDSISSSGEPAAAPASSAVAEGQNQEKTDGNVLTTPSVGEANGGGHNPSNTAALSLDENKDIEELQKHVVPSDQHSESIKDVKTPDESGSSPSNDQPEAEQHVELNVDQT